MSKPKKHVKRHSYMTQADPMASAPATTRPAMAAAPDQTSAAVIAPFVKRDLRRIALLSLVLAVVIIALGVWNTKNPWTTRFGTSIFNAIGVRQ